MIGIMLSAVLVAGFLIGVAVLVGKRVTTNIAQDRIAPFYVPPELEGTTPGDLLRYEPLDIAVAGGSAYCILYVTETAAGAPAVSSGLAFVPDAPAPGGGRPVLAWAHGTVGQGEECAPSRSADPTSQLVTFLPQMLDLGWFVVAPDYYGPGTPGTELYLIGKQEARGGVDAHITVDGRGGTHDGRTGCGTERGPLDVGALRGCAADADLRTRTTRADSGARGTCGLAATARLQRACASDPRADP